MPILDFKEIPEAHKGGGHQDTFEQFAGEFLEILGFHIASPPSRGADLGMDLVVEETRTGPGGKTTIRHLVSCKHKAHSGGAVYLSEEPDIGDRLKGHGCQGFIGVYSTIASSSLADKIKSLAVESRIYDGRMIEKELLRRPEGVQLAKRYFPKSLSYWLSQNPGPVKLQGEIPLNCEICGKDLLQKFSRTFIGGVLGYCVRLDQLDEETPQTVDVVWYCKGSCDAIMSKKLKKRGLYEDGWDDIDEYRHPYSFITYVSLLLDDAATMTEAARGKLRYFLSAVFPYVTRPLTSREETIRDRLLDLKD